MKLYNTYPGCEEVLDIAWLRGFCVISEILYWSPLLAWGMSFLTILIGLSALSMPAGGGKLTLCRLYVASLFISAMLWITYGLHFAFKVRGFYAQLLPGNYLIMKSGQAETHQSAKQSAAMVAAAFTNPLVESIASDMLPYPIDVAFYCGPRLHLIIVPFGIIPLIVCMLNLPYAISYANVVEAGGDGTEFCRAEDIPWYLSLSPAEQALILTTLFSTGFVFGERRGCGFQEKVRNGEVTDDSDDEDDKRDRHQRASTAFGRDDGGMRRRPQ